MVDILCSKLLLCGHALNGVNGWQFRVHTKPRGNHTGILICIIHLFVSYIEAIRLSHRLLSLLRALTRQVGKLIFLLSKLGQTFVGWSWDQRPVCVSLLLLFLARTRISLCLFLRQRQLLELLGLFPLLLELFLENFLILEEHHLLHYDSLIRVLNMFQHLIFIWELC